MGGKGRWRFYLVLIVISTTAVVLLNLSGVPEEGRQKIAERQTPLPAPQDALRQMPPAQLALIALGGIVWIGGVNALAVWQRRKAGLSWWACFNPLALPFSHFDGRAWRIFGFLTLATIVLGLAAFSFTPPG